MHRTGPGRQWGRGRGLDPEEDDWFNGSDDDDLPSPQPPWMQQQQRLTHSPNLKRKRAPAIVLEYPNRRRQYPPQPTPTNSPPATGLVDYDDDEPTTTTPKEASEDLKLPVISKATQIPLRTKAPRPIKLPMLGSVAEITRASGQVSPEDKAIPSGSGFPPTRNEKRRRDEDEDDELLARLATKGKRPSVSETDEDPVTGKESGIKISFGKISEGTKKIKLNLGLGHKPEAESTGRKDEEDERGG